VTILTDLVIEVDDLAGSEIAAFLAAHAEQLRSLTPPESTHVLDLEGLRRSDVRVWVARADDRIVGCGALKQLDAGSPGVGHGEIKSMRTAPTWRGRGVGGAILERMLDEARSNCWTRVSLETGADDFFAPARRLYARYGFVECAPFGDYCDDPVSVFMTR